MIYQDLHVEDLIVNLQCGDAFSVLHHQCLVKWAQAWITWMVYGFWFTPVLSSMACWISWWSSQLPPIKPHGHAGFPNSQPPAWASSKAKRPVVFSSLLTWRENLKFWVWGEQKHGHVGYPVIFASCHRKQESSGRVMKCDQPHVEFPRAMLMEQPQEGDCWQYPKRNLAGNHPAKESGTKLHIRTGLCSSFETWYCLKRLISKFEDVAETTQQPAPRNMLLDKPGFSKSNDIERYSGCQALYG